MRSFFTKLVAGALVVGVLAAFALLLKGGPTLTRALQSAAGPEQATDGATWVAATSQQAEADDDADDDANENEADDREEDCMGAFSVKLDRAAGEEGQVLTYGFAEAAPFDVMVQAEGAAGETPDVKPLELVDSEGLLIAAVVKDSAAAKAGLRRGDIILDVDGKALGDTPILDGLETVAGKKAGEAVQLKVKRGDAELAVSITLPAAELEGKAHGFLGILPAMEGHGPMHLFTRRVGGPGMVLDVIADSAAAKAGIKAGERIISVDGQAVGEKPLTELIGAHKPGDTVTLKVAAKDAKDDAARTVTVALGENPDKKGSAFLGVKMGMDLKIDVKGMHGGLMPHLRQWFHHGRGGKAVPGVPGVPAAPDKVVPQVVPPASMPELKAAPSGSSM